jgi:pimeloyl-ACP methyl ester carboxylesterase
VNGRIDLLGFSFGGCVAQQFALDRPELVERVVLAGTAPRGAKEVGTRSAAEALNKRETAGPPNVDEILRLLFAQSEASKDAGRAFIARTDRRQKDRDAPVAAKTVAAQTEALKAWGSATEGADSNLAGLKQPVLVADGAADVVFPTKNSIHLAQVLPHAQLVVYPDSAHGFLFQYPERFAEHVSTFLRRP